MPREKKQVESGEAPGAPEWMVTFSDCMTLLLTFFVLLLTFSSFDEHIFQKLKTTFADFPSVGVTTREARDALSRSRQIESAADISEGSEKPTLEQGKQDGLKEQTGPDDFRSKKVFLTTSEQVFWGRGTYISLQGRRTLDTLASLLKQLPGRVVISENASGQSSSPAADGQDSLGLNRAWAVMEYLVAKQEFDKNRLSISAARTVPDQWVADNEQRTTNNEQKRLLEVVLLEPNIYQ
jgi:chemotaxis protein MotB